MRSIIDIDYIITEDGTYVGWAKNYTAVVAQAKSEEELEEKILVSLKVMFNYMIGLIDKKTIKTNLKNKTVELEKLK